MLKLVTPRSEAIPDQWIGRDGMPVTDEEKIQVLNKNLEEIEGMCQGALEEALNLGCSEHFFRIVLTDMIDKLKRPS